MEVFATPSETEIRVTAVKQTEKYAGTKSGAMRLLNRKLDSSARKTMK